MNTNDSVLVNFSSQGKFVYGKNELSKQDFFWNAMTSHASLFLAFSKHIKLSYLGAILFLLSTKAASYI